MSATPISIRKIKEVLWLKFDAGLSQHQIAAAAKPGSVIGSRRVTATAAKRRPKTRFFRRLLS